MSRRHLLFYIPLSVVCVASFQAYVDEADLPFHGDESIWLANARALELVLDGEFDHLYWRSYDGWTQPHAGHYVYGIVLRAAGFSYEEFPKRYHSNEDLEWNRQRGRVPTEAVLLAGRRFSALCGAAACVVLCGILQRGFGWTAGLVAACWLAFNPLMRSTCQRAMVDGQVTLALVVGIALLLALYRAWGRDRGWVVALVSVGVGLFFGFAASLKLNAGILCAIAITALPCFAVHVYLQTRRTRSAKCRRTCSEPVETTQPRPGRNRNLAQRQAKPDPGDPAPNSEIAPVSRLLGAAGSVLIVCTFALPVFYALNPHIWQTGLLDGARTMIELRDADIAAQQANHPESALHAVSQRVRAAADILFVRRATLRSHPIQSLKHAAGVGAQRQGLWYVEGPLFLLGTICLIARIVNRARCDRIVDSACILAIWLVLYSIFVFLFMPLSWARYYQKFLPLQAILFGIGSMALVELVKCLGQTAGLGRSTSRIRR